MENHKNARRLLGFACLAELFIASDIAVSGILVRVMQDAAAQKLLSWLVIYPVWGVGTALVSKWSGPLRRYPYRARPQWTVFLGALAVSALLTAVAWGGFKPYLELKGAVQGLGPGLGLTAFGLQYLYYALEAALMLLILACGQRAGEQWFPNRRLPYASVVLAVLWGLPHLCTQGLVDGLWVTAQALVYGAAYYAVRTEGKKLYPLMFLIFVL